MSAADRSRKSVASHRNMGGKWNRYRSTIDDIFYDTKSQTVLIDTCLKAFVLRLPSVSNKVY